MQPTYGRFTAQPPASPEPPMRWRDWLDIAKDALHEAEYKAESQRERLAKMGTAINAINSAREELVAPVRFPWGAL